MKKPVAIALVLLGAASLLMGAVFLLSGDGEEPQLPEAYSAGEDSLPSLTALVTLDPVPECAVQTQEDTTSYQYTPLEDAVQTVADYRSALESDYDCAALSPAGARLSADTELSSEGSLILARESASGSGLFQLTVSWDETSCTVTPSLDKEASLPEDTPSMTMGEVEAYFRTLSPATLGLPGTDMSGYQVFCENGLVLLDGMPCLCLNVYQAEGFRASYLFSTATREIYQLDRSSGIAQPLSS